MADGYCPLCMASELKRLRAAVERKDEAIEQMFNELVAPRSGD